MMLYIYNDSNDPYYNLAAEEYLLQNVQDDIFMLWVNQDVIVVGRNQNTLSEINYDYVKEQNIAVVRRLTGGGAVFHDKGNLNFTFIQNSKDNYSDFSHFAEPIIGALGTIGIKAKNAGRNDLVIDGKKFSGNAQCVHKGRVMHHGTIMLEITLDKLEKALRVNPLKIKSKGVKSVRSRVTNINEHLDTPITIDQLRDIISTHIAACFPDIVPYLLTDADKAGIQRLADEKYRTWEWNFAESPKYNFTKQHLFPGGLIEAHLDVIDGVITAARLFGDYFGEYDVSAFEQALKGVKHNRESLEQILNKIDIAKYFIQAKAEDILNALL